MNKIFEMVVITMLEMNTMVLLLIVLLVSSITKI